MKSTPYRVLTVCILAALFMTGCLDLSPKPDPTQFFVLGTQTEPPDQPANLEGPTIGIGPVSFPGYVERPQLAVRAAENEVRFLTFQRWAEPVDEGFLRVLGQNMEAQLPNSRVTIYPFPEQPSPDYTIMMEVLRFEAHADGFAELAVRWRVLEGAGGNSLYFAESRYREELPESATGNGNAIARALSAATAAYSKDLAARIKDVASQ